MRGVNKRIQLLEEEVPKVKFDIVAIRNNIASLKLSIGKVQDGSAEIQGSVVDSVFSEMWGRETDSPTSFITF